MYLHSKKCDYPCLITDNVSTLKSVNSIRQLCTKIADTKVYHFMKWYNGYIFAYDNRHAASVSACLQCTKKYNGINSLDVYFI